MNRLVRRRVCFSAEIRLLKCSCKILLLERHCYITYKILPHAFRAYSSGVHIFLRMLKNKLIIEGGVQKSIQSLEKMLSDRLDVQFDYLIT